MGSLAELNAHVKATERRVQGAREQAGAQVLV